MFIFSGKSPCCITALLLTSFYIAANKECITKRLIILRSVDSAFPLLYCLKFSFKSVEIVLSVMQENDRVFFLKHGVSECRRGVVVNALDSINVVTLRWARLDSAWMGDRLWTGKQQ